MIVGFRENENDDKEPGGENSEGDGKNNYNILEFLKTRWNMQKLNGQRFC
jgi:hypothetical protein